MSRGWSTTVSSTSASAFRFAVRQPSWVARAALLAGVVVFLAVLAILIVPAVIIAVAVFILMALIARVRALFNRMRSPNGALDGRRNVRVITRE